MTKYSDEINLKLYLSPIVDMYNGEILSYGIHIHPTLDFVMKLLEDAFQIVKDSKYRTTIYPNQGWHYQYRKWVKTLKGHHVGCYFYVA